MSKVKKDLHMPASSQGHLFDESLSDGALDVRMAFRDTVSRVITRSGMDRWRIAGEISRLSGHELSKDMLDKCTSSNFDYGLRAESLPALMRVLQSLDPVRVLLNPLGCEAADPTETEFVRLARLEKKHAELFEELATLRAKLGIRK